MQLKPLLKSAIEETPPHKFCVYYDEWNGEIIQITNRPKDSRHPHIETPDETAKKLMMGELSFSKYQVAQLVDGPKLMPKDNVIRLRQAENVLSQIESVKLEIQSDINIIFYINDWKLEINFSQDTMFRMTGARDSRNARIQSDQTKPFDFYLIKGNDPTFLLKHIKIDPIDLMSSGYILYDLSELRTICGLGDINVLTKRIFKSYGIKYKQHYTGSDYHRRKTQRRVHKQIETHEEYATFSISKANTGWIFKSNFDDPKEQKIYRDMTLFFTKDDPTYLTHRIKIPFDNIGWRQEYIVDTELNFEDKILLGENAKNITFKIEEMK